jgi:glucosylceramidase
MPSKQTRRHFLQVLSAGLILPFTPAALSMGATSRSSAEQSDGDIKVWSTVGEKRFSESAPIKWHAAASGESGATIVLNPEKRFQEILGFGAAFTDSACYTFNQIEEAPREKLFRELFDPKEMGLSVCRSCIGASDYSIKAYSFDDGDADAELKRFSIAHDRDYILPMLRLARKINPDLFLLATPWSPPGWMKSNNSMLGGNMQRKYMASYAHYFLKFLRAYEAEGVPVQAVSVQNEVDTDQDGRMPACSWPQEYEADFVRLFLGPLLEKEGLKTKIWLIDHNYNLWGRALDELELPDIRKYASGIAWHGYVGEPEAMTRVHDAYPEIGAYWTEGGPEYTAPDYLADWSQWSKTFTGILRNWSRSITAWNLALDEVGKPNIGPFSCGGLVTVNSKSKEITRSGQYWALAHFSRCIKRGAKRFDSHANIQDIHHVAFENPDGQKVLVLTNTGSDRATSFQIGGQAAHLELEKNSVTTVAWR